MSRRPKRKPPRGLGAHETVRRALGPLEGARVPGGCDACDAYQTVMPIAAGAWSIAVHHDDGCPWYAGRDGGAS